QRVDRRQAPPDFRQLVQDEQDVVQQGTAVQQMRGKAEWPNTLAFEETFGTSGRASSMPSAQRSFAAACFGPECDVAFSPAEAVALARGSLAARGSWSRVCSDSS
ncbi:hypothetical protein ACFQ07_30450, partial [Actinomadura adrarensis]